ncbi:MAG: LuxR C-terminal-related transcriptional regulator [Candidatus Acidiferrales bacterium]
MKLRFTRRQEDILDLLRAKRYSNKEIGAILHIGESTVKYHITLLLAKTRLADRDELTDWAREHGRLWERTS